MREELHADTQTDVNLVRSLVCLQRQFFFLTIVVLIYLGFSVFECVEKLTAFRPGIANVLLLDLGTWFEFWALFLSIENISGYLIFGHVTFAYFWTWERISISY